MKATDHGKFTGPGEIVFVRRLPGSIERVWTYLTDSQLRAKWLAGGTMELRVGGSVELEFHHADLSPIPEKVPAKYEAMCAAGCKVTGRVTRLEPPRLLSYTWGNGEGENSEVTFELTPFGAEVQLVLTHRRLGDNLDTQASVAAGWHTHLAILIATLGGGPPLLFWATHTKREAEYLQRLEWGT